MKAAGEAASGRAQKYFGMSFCGQCEDVMNCKILVGIEVCKLDFSPHRQIQRHARKSSEPKAASSSQVNSTYS